MIDANQTLGDLATAHPEATTVFLRHRLDFCCGGGRKLVDACRSAGIDPATVLAELTDLEAGESGEEPVHWAAEPLGKLVDHIQTKYHEAHRRDLPALVAAARKVERVHADKPHCPHGLADHLAHVEAEMYAHMAKEEQILFPAISHGHRGPSVHMPIRVMMHEHEEHGSNLDRIRELTGDLIPPEGACRTWRALYAGLAQLEAELMEHIHLENNVLFPRALNG